MTSLDDFVDLQILRGRAYFSRDEVKKAVDLRPAALSSAITRLIGKGRLANPRHEFYLILRLEDRAIGAPDAVRWIGPLMAHQKLDYRISLLRAAAFHGASHQAAMVFQVIVPRQLRDVDLGRHQLRFVYQSADAFASVNIDDLVDRIKSDAGFAKVAGIELTLLDCARYIHKAGGINSVAQIVRDIGMKARTGLIVRAAAAYESAAVRRLGYLLEHGGHLRQAAALEKYATNAKTFALLDSSERPLGEGFPRELAKNAKWKLLINENVEFDF